METTTDPAFGENDLKLTNALTNAGVDLDVAEVERRLELGWYCNICTCFCICLGDDQAEYVGG